MKNYTAAQLEEKAKEIKREYFRRYREENREHLNEYQRNWKAENKKKQRDYYRRYWINKAIEEFEQEAK